MGDRVPERKLTILTGTVLLVRLGHGQTRWGMAYTVT